VIAVLSVASAVTIAALSDLTAPADRVPEGCAVAVGVGPCGRHQDRGVAAHLKSLSE